MNFINLHVISFLIVLLCFFSCKSPDRKSDINSKDLADEVLQTEFALSNSLLSDFTLHESKHVDSLKFSKQIEDFYSQRDYKPMWTDNKGLSAFGIEMQQALQRVEEYGLIVSNYPVAEIELLIKKIQSVKTEALIKALRGDLEIWMTESYFLLGMHLHHGMLDKDSLTYNYNLNRMPVDMIEYLEEAANNQNITGSLLDLQPQFRAYKKLQKHNAIFLETHADVDMDKALRLSDNASDEEKFEFVRTYLLAENYLDSLSITDDSLVAEAIKVFQRRHGLVEDGKSGKNSLHAMQISLKDKKQSIMVNMQRLRWTNSLPEAYILVNSAAYTLKVIESDSIVRSHRVVIGSKTNITPEISSEIEYMVCNPIWFVPYSISTKEILPKVKEDQSYLARNSYRIYTADGQRVSESELDWSEMNSSNFKYKIRQLAGSQNSLGSIKFIFPNEHSIYLHDTPSKTFFERDLRTFSHGCVRLEEPVALAHYLLEFDNNEVTPDSLDTLLKKKITQRINLNKPYPIFIKYYTCAVNEYNEIVFYKDVYKRDQRIYEALIAKSLLKEQIAERGF